MQKLVLDGDIYSCLLWTEMDYPEWSSIKASIIGSVYKVTLIIFE